MPLGSTLFPPIPQPVNPPPGGMQLPSMSTFLAMSNLGENDTTSIPQANFSRNYNTTHDGFIDLTAEPASPTQPSDFSSPASPSDSEFIAFLQEETPPTQSTVDSASMPRQQVTTIQEPSRKRRRLNSGPPSPRRHTSTNQPSQTRREPDNFVTIDSPSREEPSEILDLTEVEGTNALHKVQEEQRERHVALQEQQNQLLKESVQAQEPENKGPFKLGQVQCVICMDNMTDMTATHCGQYSFLSASAPALMLTAIRSHLLPHMHHGSADSGRESRRRREGST